MPFRIDETFTVRASVERVWQYLIDPRRVVECLPGAALTEQQDARTYLGTVKVKVGPVTAVYSGRAVLADVNDAEHRVLITAEGRESAGAGGGGGGGGSARMRMTSTVTVDDVGSRVRVEAELDIAGKIVQFGRGMIETVNKQLFAQFTACMRSTLEAPAPFAVPSFAAAPVPLAPADATRVAVRAAATNAPSVRPSAAEPVRILPLLFRALIERFARLLGRRRAE